MAETGWVGSGVKVLAPNAITEIEAQHNQPYTPGTEVFEWQFEIWAHSNWNIVTFRSPNNIDLDYWQNPYPSQETIYIRGRNACGWSPYQETFWTVGSFYLMNYYPNPAKDFLTLHFKINNNLKNSLPDHLLLYSEKSNVPVKQVSMSDVLRNNSLVEGDKLILDVSNLSPGVYYLHLTSKEQKTEKIRILLE